MVGLEGCIASDLERDALAVRLNYASRFYKGRDEERLQEVDFRWTGRDNIQDDGVGLKSIDENLQAAINLLMRYPTTYDGGAEYNFSRLVDVALDLFFATDSLSRVSIKYGPIRTLASEPSADTQSSHLHIGGDMRFAERLPVLVLCTWRPLSN